MKNLKYIILLFGLAEIAYVDRREKRISNKMLGIFLMLRIIILMFGIISEFEYCKMWMMDAVLGFAVGGGLFLACYCASKNAIGAGDVKLLAIVGSYLGSDKILWTAFFSVSYTFLYFLWKLFIQKEKTKVAFSPFVFMGVTTVLLFNDSLP